MQQRAAAAESGLHPVERERARRRSTRSIEELGWMVTL